MEASDRPAGVSDEERRCLTEIAGRIPEPRLGLPDEVLAFAMYIVPMINVDLVTFDAAGRTLLAWREDEYGTGWHVPGSIIRGEESIEQRILETARTELGVDVETEPAPSAIVQLSGARGTFISLAFRARPTGRFEREPGSEMETAADGGLSWFDQPPTQLYPTHDVYRELLPSLRAGRPVDAPLMRAARFSPASGGWAVLG